MLQISHTGLGFSFSSLVKGVENVAKSAEGAITQAIPVAAEVASVVGVPGAGAVAAILPKIQGALQTTQRVAGQLQTNNPSVQATVTAAPGAQQAQAHAHHAHHKFKAWHAWIAANPQKWAAWQQQHPDVARQYAAWGAKHPGLGGFDDFGRSSGGHGGYRGGRAGHAFRRMSMTHPHHRFSRGHYPGQGYPGYPSDGGGGGPQDQQQQQCCSPDPSTGQCFSPNQDADPSCCPVDDQTQQCPTAPPQQAQQAQPAAAPAAPAADDGPPGGLNGCATRYNRTSNSWSVYCPGGASSSSGLGVANSDSHCMFGDCGDGPHGMVKVGEVPYKPFGMYDLGAETDDPYYKKWQFWAVLTGAVGIVGTSAYAFVRRRRFSVQITPHGRRR